MKEPIRVTVLGGGVIGLTTGILLALRGYRTAIVTRHRLDRIAADETPAYPLIASLHAAASVLPHSVALDDSAGALATSQLFFRLLASTPGCGVRVQRHHELFERPAPLPAYAPALARFEPLADDGLAWTRDREIPRRRGVERVFGWSFDMFFCDAPVYLRRLYLLFAAAGGEIRESAAVTSRRELLALDGDVLVNCAGAGALELFPEDAPNVTFLRGHLVQVHVPADATRSSDARERRDVSYSYSPTADVYPGERGGAGDVYFYPRSDGWILGGSRQRGDWDDDGGWVSEEEPAGEELRLEGWKIAVPAPIWRLNRELIQGLTGFDVDRCPSSASVGFRCLRDPLRLERDVDPSGGKPVVHHYGHGGAGYALSWGTSLEAVRIVDRCAGKESGDAILRSLLTRLREICARRDRAEDARGLR